MKFRQVESNQRPALVDDMSSPHGVYIRQNIEEKTYIDEETKEEITYFSYEEAFITQVEYDTLQATKYAIEQAREKREDEIIDDYTAQLIEEGVI